MAKALAILAFLTLAAGLYITSAAPRFSSQLIFDTNVAQCVEDAECESDTDCQQIETLCTQLVLAGEYVQ